MATRKKDDDRWEAEWKAGYQHPGDYLAGEPPNVDLVGYTPEQAPYPRSWTPQQRLDMTWYAQRQHIRVDYNDAADDEGASGWLPAMEALLRDRRGRTAAVAVARVAGADPQPQLATGAPEPAQPPDPGEPRHPREFEGW